MHNHKAIFCTRNHKVILCRMKNNAIFLWKGAKWNLYIESYAWSHIMKLMFGKVVMEGIRTVKLMYGIFK